MPLLGATLFLVWIEMLKYFQLFWVNSSQHNIPPLHVCHRACSQTEVCSSGFYSARQEKATNRDILYRWLCNIKHETSPDVLLYLGKYTQLNGTPVLADKSNASTVSIELILTVPSQAYWSSRWPRSICHISVIPCSGCLYGNRWW